MESKMNDGWKNANKEGVERILNKFRSGQDPFQLNKGKLILDYRKHGRTGPEEFALNYSFGWHALHHKLDDTESKQALFLLVFECVLEET
jgi:hypothetical protein